MFNNRSTLIHNLSSVFVALVFSLTAVIPQGYAQNAQGVILPAPGIMVGLTEPLSPPMLKGLIIHPQEPFKFDFILDQGHSTLSGEDLKEEANKLIKYFLASLTIPEDELWVNLSPYEKDRIISDAFGQTEMGRDLLAQDYVLKQLTASLMYPEKELGKEFWQGVYKKAYEQYGTTDIPVDTFNKVWIVPQEATVYEDGDRVFIVKSHLKVMLEADYVAAQAVGDKEQESVIPAKAGIQPSNLDSGVRRNDSSGVIY